MNGQALSVVALRSIGSFDLNILMTSNPMPAGFFLCLGFWGSWGQGLIQGLTHHFAFFFFLAFAIASVMTSVVL
ncbi:MAG: hypothetical protein IJQ71_07820, partial [Clostridia bacterium]|nr:hypothetical protein [Clostridia bacterium]